MLTVAEMDADDHRIAVDHTIALRARPGKKLTQEERDAPLTDVELDIVREAEGIVRRQRDPVTGALPDTLVLITRSREKVSPEEAKAREEQLIHAFAELLLGVAMSRAAEEAAKVSKSSPTQQPEASSPPMTALRRHYLHGDPHEKDSDLYYCKAHDAFVARGHFDGCELGAVVRRGVKYRETHEWRFVTQRRESLTPKLVKLRAEGGFRAIDDPKNLFRTGTAAEQKLPKLERSLQ